METAVKKRRKRGPAALGDVNVTKFIVSSMIEDELKQRLAKTQRLREMRLAMSEGECKREL